MYLYSHLYLYFYLYFYFIYVYIYTYDYIFILYIHIFIFICISLFSWSPIAPKDFSIEERSGCHWITDEQKGTDSLVTTLSLCYPSFSSTFLSLVPLITSPAHFLFGPIIVLVYFPFLLLRYSPDFYFNSISLSVFNRGSMSVAPVVSLPLQQMSLQSLSQIFLLQRTKHRR